MRRGLLDEYKIRKQSVVNTIIRYINSILTDPQTRNIFFFLLLNLSFCFVEFFYGYILNSLSLTSDAVHMLFDSTAILLSLGASVVTSRARDLDYSYGYGRVETMTGFINGLALIFASMNIIFEAVERLLTNGAQDLKTENLLFVSVLGLLVNIVGIFAFDHGGALGHAGHCHSDHGHEHSHGKDHSHHGHDHGQNPLMQGMFLHILSDALGSVGVIISSLLIQYYGWYWSDPLCSILISLLTLYGFIYLIIGTWPLVKSSGEVLLQRTPRSIDSNQLMIQLRHIRHVLNVKTHFWEMKQNSFVVTVNLFVDQNCDDLYIREEVFRILNGMDITMQIERDCRVTH